VTAVERPIVPSVVLPARAWTPPNRWMYALAVGIALIVLEASSRGSWVVFFLGEMVGMVLLAVWLFGWCRRSSTAA